MFRKNFNPQNGLPFPGEIKRSRVNRDDTLLGIFFSKFLRPLPVNVPSSERVDFGPMIVFFFFSYKHAKMIKLLEFLRGLSPQKYIQYFVTESVTEFAVI